MKDGEVTLTVYLPVEVKADLREASIDAMTPMSRMAGELIAKGLERLRNQEKEENES